MLARAYRVRNIVKPRAAVGRVQNSRNNLPRRLDLAYALCRHPRRRRNKTLSASAPACLHAWYSVRDDDEKILFVCYNV